MASTAGRDTKPERLLRRELHRRGLRFRVDQPVLRDRRRRADIVFTRARVAVFVDGCFWHGCPQHATWPRANAAFWREKIATNRMRDADTTAQLEAEGWVVVRIWEHADVDNAADHVEQVVRARALPTTR